MPRTALPSPVNEAPRRFTCRSSIGAQVTILAPEGELDIATVPELDAALRAESETPLVVLDLRALEFIDSSGAHLLLAADRRLRGANRRLLVLLEYGGDIEWLLALTGADRQLHLTDQDAELIAAA